MVTKEQIQQIIKNQGAFDISQKTIKRNTDIEVNTNRIVVITGIRRCGKSTLLRRKFEKTNEAIFVNFEDPRLSNFALEDFYKIEEIAKEAGKNIFVFDEIQNIPKWERYARSAYDSGIMLYITGSNASMLSRELGTRLTGRHKQIELFPFDYEEYCTYTNKTQGDLSCIDFLKDGGFPEYLEEKDPEYLQTLLKDIVVRDIAVRNNIRNNQLLLRLAVNLISNISKEFSYNKLSKTLSIKSVRTTIDYCDFLKESYLLEFIPKFSFSIHQQQNNPKKVYACDTGMVNANSLSFSDDNGRLFENAVYLKLRKHFKDIQYYKDDKSECDFIVKQGNKITHAIQVCWKLTNENLERELNGLKNAIKNTKPESKLIITFNQEEHFADIEAVPFWKWKINEKYVKSSNP